MVIVSSEKTVISEIILMVQILVLPMEDFISIIRRHILVMIEICIRVVVVSFMVLEILVHENLQKVKHAVFFFLIDHA